MQHSAESAVRVARKCPHAAYGCTALFDPDVQPNTCVVRFVQNIAWSAVRASKRVDAVYTAQRLKCGSRNTAPGVRGVLHSLCRIRIVGAPPTSR